MKIDDLLSEWDNDVPIDQTALSDGMAGVAKLHAKYLRFFVTEKMVLKELQKQHRILKLKKWEHFSQGPNEETRDWPFPAQGKILKAEVERYIEADEMLNELQLKIDLAAEKVAALESMIKMIGSRGYNISSIMNWNKWTGGG